MTPSYRREQENIHKNKESRTGRICKPAKERNGRIIMTKSKRENLCFSVAVSVAVEIAAYFLLALVLSYFAAGRSDPASMVGIAAYATVFLTFGLGFVFAHCFARKQAEMRAADQWAVSRAAGASFAHCRRQRDNVRHARRLRYGGCRYTHRPARLQPSPSRYGQAHQKAAKAPRPLSIAGSLLHPETAQ